MANVQVIKLKTGEELMSDLSFKDGNYTLKNVIQLAVGPDGHGGFGVAVLPFLPYVEAPSEGFTIPRDSVMMGPFRPQKDLLGKYTKAFSALDLPAPPKLIVP